MGKTILRFRVAGIEQDERKKIASHSRQLEAVDSVDFFGDEMQVVTAAETQSDAREIADEIISAAQQTGVELTLPEIKADEEKNENSEDSEKATSLTETAAPRSARERKQDAKKELFGRLGILAASLVALIVGIFVRDGGGFSFKTVLYAVSLTLAVYEAVFEAAADLIKNKRLDANLSVAAALVISVFLAKTEISCAVGILFGLTFAINDFGKKLRRADYVFESFGKTPAGKEGDDLADGKEKDVSARFSVGSRVPFGAVSLVFALCSALGFLPLGDKAGDLIYGAALLATLICSFAFDDEIGSFRKNAALRASFDGIEFQNSAAAAKLSATSSVEFAGDVLIRDGEFVPDAEGALKELSFRKVKHLKIDSEAHLSEKTLAETGLTAGEVPEPKIRFEMQGDKICSADGNIKIKNEMRRVPRAIVVSRAMRAGKVGIIALYAASAVFAVVSLFVGGASIPAAAITVATAHAAASLVALSAFRA